MGEYPVYLSTHTSTDGSGDNVDFVSDTVSIIDGSLNDVLTNSIATDYSKHTLHYNILGLTDVTDGSIKVTLAPEFDLSGVIYSDVIVTGGDVVWGTPSIETDQTMVIIPFVGTLGEVDGLITIVIGNDNMVKNPGVMGSYLINLSVYDSIDASGDPLTSHQTIVYITNEVVVTATVPSSLTMTILGVESDQSVNGVLTNVVTTSDKVDFGIIGAGLSKIGAQDIKVQQNATNGFVVTAQAMGTLSSLNNDIIADFGGTNESPVDWQIPTGVATGYWGYTTNDMTLTGNNPARFATNKWAGLTMEPSEVMYDGNPTLGDEEGKGIIRVGYRVEVDDRQAAGSYSNQVMYVCTPMY